jgi:Domain of Unknown Function with PDB structure (DUF3857)
MKFTLLTLALFITSISFAQKDKDYNQMATEIEQKIWGTKDPLFESNELPAEYKNESGVILAQKHTIETDSKKKSSFLGFRSVLQGTFSKTVREKIYLNDQSSLDEYSQLSFSKLQSKRSGMLTKNIAYSFLGIRVIKPNGTVEKINVDETAVTLKETSDGKKNKIAIPNLAIGDIIDYYITSYDKVEVAGSIETMMFVLSDDYPIVNYSINILFDKRIAAEYQCINGAPDFRVRGVEDDNLMEITAKNLPKIKNLVWSSMARQMPLARIKYAFGDIYHSAGNMVKKGSVQKVVTADDVETSVQNSLANYMMSIPSNNNIKKEWEKYSSTRKGAQTGDSIAAFVYYYYRYYNYGNYKDLAEGDFASAEEFGGNYYQLQRGMEIVRTLDEVFDIKGEVIMITGRNSVKRSNLFSGGDLNFMIRIYTPKPTFLYLGGSLYNYGEIYPAFEGEQGKYVSFKSKKTGLIIRRVIGYEVEDQGVATPNKTDYKTNNHSEKLTIEIDKANQQLLNIKRNVLSKGHLRRDMQSSLEIWEDYCKSERAKLGYDTDMQKFWTDKGKDFKKSIDEFNTKLTKARETVKEKFEAEVNGQYDSKPKELKSYKILNHGFRHSDPGFAMEEEFTMDGWVKKAGNNFIVEIGKLAGSQMEIKANQRDRKLDIYMPFARSFTDTIQLIIPDGYTVEGLDKLNKKTENECGGFVTTAKVEGNQLIVTTNKYYVNAVEPVANWAKLTAFVDAAFDFGKEKVLLKKK